MELLLEKLPIWKTLFEVILIIGIMIVYSVNSFYTHKILKLVKHHPYRWITRHFLWISLGFVISFGYLLIMFILGKHVLLTAYGVYFIRPIIFFLGCNMFANTRTTLAILKKGGKTLWILPRLEN